MTTDPAALTDEISRLRAELAQAQKWARVWKHSARDNRAHLLATRRWLANAQAERDALREACAQIVSGLRSEIDSAARYGEWDMLGIAALATELAALLPGAGPAKE